MRPEGLEGNRPQLDSRLEECIRIRNIREEDVPHIIRILELSKRSLIENFHNTFTPSWGTPESVRRELSHSLSLMANNDPDRELFEIMIRLLGTYDLYALYHLERVLEEIHP